METKHRICPECGDTSYWLDCFEDGYCLVCASKYGQLHNLHDELVTVMRNTLTSLQITTLPRLDNTVASNDQIIGIVIVSLRTVLAKCEKKGE